MKLFQKKYQGGIWCGAFVKAFDKKGKIVMDFYLEEAKKRVLEQLELLHALSF